MITTKKIDPRPYQQKAAAAIHREWDAGNKKTLVVMPTGTGKTIVFASIVNDQVAKGEHVFDSCAPGRAFTAGKRQAQDGDGARDRVRESAKLGARFR